MKRYLIKAIAKLRRRRKRAEVQTFEKVRETEREIQAEGTTCMNCNVPLTGPYCHICGQKDDDLRRPIWTFFRELLDNFFSADSRLVKSLILLVLVPGGLTRAFRMGRRARFIPPFRLYLIVSVAFFMVVSLMNVAIIDINLTYNQEKADALERLVTERSEQKAATEEQAAAEPEGNQGAPNASTSTETEAPQDKDTAAAPTTAVEEKFKRIDTVLNELDGNEDLSPEAREKIRTLASNKDLLLELGEEDTSGGGGFDIDDLPYDVDFGMFVPITGEPRAGLRQEDIDKIIGDEDQLEAVKKLATGFSKALKNPKLFNRLFNEWLPRALFVLMPIFAVILRIFHWGKERNYLNQLVFSLHFHSFLFLLFMGMMFLIPTFGGQLGFELFWIGTSLYLIIALKVGQGQGFLRAFLKAGFIWVSYFTLMSGSLMYIIYEGLQEL